MFKSFAIAALLGYTFASPSTDITGRMLQEEEVVVVPEEGAQEQDGGKKRGGRGRGGRGRGGKGGKGKGGDKKSWGSWDKKSWGGKKGWSKKDMAAKKAKWEAMTEEEKAEAKAKWAAEWEKKKANATPEQRAKMEEWEKKKEEWNNMTDEEKAAKKAEWKAKKEAKRKEKQEQHGRKAMEKHRKNRKYAEMSEEEKAALIAEKQALWEAKREEWAKKIVEKKGLNEEQAAAFYKHIQNLSFKQAKNSGKGGKKGGRGGRGGKGRGRKLEEAHEGGHHMHGHQGMQHGPEHHRGHHGPPHHQKGQHGPHHGPKHHQRGGHGSHQRPEHHKPEHQRPQHHEEKPQEEAPETIEVVDVSIELTDEEADELVVINENIANPPQVGDDPKRDYFEKLGSQFTSGFLAGTQVGEFDEVDLFECLHAEPTAVEYFYKADETMKEALVKHNADGVVKSVDELLGFLIEMIHEDYPHTHTQVCKTFDQSKAHWDDLERIMKLEKDKETTLQDSEGKFYFNKHDITAQVREVAEDYTKSEWRHLGYALGKTMNDASKEGNLLFLN